MNLAHNGTEVSPTPKSGGRGSLGFAALLLLCGITWMLSHGYQGIVHDARLYTLQALAHVSRNSLPNDVFLHFGSQDRYTIFSPLYAGASRLLGMEPAAAVLTLLQQLALLGSAWLVARQATVTPMALMGLAILLAIPGNYGPDRIFTCIEPFLTPRMASEALVLGGLAAALNHRAAVAVVLVAMATLIHPIIASAGIAALLCYYFAIRRPHSVLAIAAVAALVIATLAYAALAYKGWQFDPTWFLLVKDRSPYLFLAHWTLDDWSAVGVTLATLIIGALTLPSGNGRSLSQVALVATVGGLALTLIACDLLHLALLTQLQPWRWQWIGVVTGALLLPQILRLRWQSGVAARATALLLVAAWIFGLGEFALVASAAAVLSASFAQRLTVREARLLVWGAVGMLAIAIVWRVATNLEFTEAYYLEPSMPLWLRKAMSFWHDGSAPMALIALVWWLCRSASGRTGLIMLVVLAMVACAILLPATWARWTIREFPPQFTAQFAPWRRIIPPGADVFWPESPVAAWLLLDRPSYLSSIQTAGIIFSRDAAMEMQRRAEVLKPVLPPSVFFDWNTGGSGLTLSPQQLLDVCQLGAFEFLVTSTDLRVPAAAFLASKSGPASKGLRLYHCPVRPGTN